MAGAWRWLRGTGPKEIARKRQEAASSDCALRTECINLALQTCQPADKTPDQIIEAAQGYYDFITGRRQEWLDWVHGYSEIQTRDKHKGP